VITNAGGRDVEKRESLCSVGGNVYLIQVLWKTIWRFLKQLKIELPYDPATPCGYISKIK